MSTKEQLPLILEAILFAAGKPLSEQQLLQLFAEEERPGLADLRQAIFTLQEFYSTRGVELVCIASGYQFQSKIDFAMWIGRLWEEKPSKYSRALLETLALIAYRQPITRGEIEEIRGVSISTSIFKTLLEDRGWIRVVGHRDVPGRPGLYATTKQFLDYFGLHSLDQLPPLPEILALADLNVESAAQQMQLPELLQAVVEDEAIELATEPEIAEPEITESVEELYEELEATEI